MTDPISFTQNPVKNFVETVKNITLCKTLKNQMTF